MGARKPFYVLSGLAIASATYAQVPDLLTAFDAGARAMGAGGAFNALATDPMSGALNPAGLGYVSRKTFSLATRALPTTETAVTGPLTDLRLNSTQMGGDYSLTHMGFAVPLQGGGRGTWGIAYTAAGWFNDRQFGQNLPGGIQTYLDFTRVKTDLFTFSFGRTSGDQASAFGVGLVYGQVSVRNSQRIVFTDPNIDPQTAFTDETGTGIGAVAGFMHTPPSRPNMTLGVSLRTPISITNNKAGVSDYSRIPGRIAGSVAIRRDGMRGGRDFIVYGTEIQHYFDGKRSNRLDRTEQTTVGFGAEYHYGMDNGTVNFRLGYLAVPAGGRDFDDRNSLTYGLGYRPKGKPWAIDLNFGSPTGGGRDAALMFTYQFGK